MKMTFTDICKSIKSTDDFTFEVVIDNTQYFYIGIETTVNNIEVNGKHFTYCCDLFPLFDGDYHDWSEGKEFFINDFIQASDLDVELNEFGVSRDSILYNQLKEAIIRSNKYIASQITTIAEDNDINLDDYFEDEDEYEDEFDDEFDDEG